ncbi:hypothetical protein DFH09DRAFT_1069857 [Mycena vulgaris]|nr:hypothetical protein DFH09DRAFT_1069857 [Mycena vulgaris]
MSSNYKTIPPGATWVTVHEQNSEDSINTNDATATLGESGVQDWANRILWLRLGGEQRPSRKINCSTEATLEDSTSADILERICSVASDKRVGTDTGKTQGRTPSRHRPRTLRTQWDELGAEIKHIIPFEMGAGLLSELLSNPVIGNVTLTGNKYTSLTLHQGPENCINHEQNLLLAASSRPCGLSLKKITHSVAAFASSFAHPDIPIPKPLLVESLEETRRCIVRSLADVAIIYLRFGSDSLCKETRSVLNLLKTELEALKAKRKRQLEDERSEGTQTGTKKRRKFQEGPNPMSKTGPVGQMEVMRASSRNTQACAIEVTCLNTTSSDLEYEDEDEVEDPLFF